MCDKCDCEATRLKRNLEIAVSMLYERAAITSSRACELLECKQQDFRQIYQPSEVLTVADYEEVIADHNRLVRELDVLLNGENAAKQASLCDIVAQLAKRKQTTENKKQCVANPLYSRVCEFGTKGCNEIHLIPSTRGYNGPT